MDKFHDVTSFLMLPDSEYEPDREYFVQKTGREWLHFYERSKEAWEVHGDDGPPVGSTIFYVHNRVWATMLGVFKRDERFFELSLAGDMHGRNIIIERKMWWRYLHISASK